MDRLVPIGSLDTPDWINDMGTYNTLPTPFVEVLEKDFHRVFSAFNPQYLEFRQVRIPSEERLGLQDVHIFYFYDTAFAMVHPIGSSGARYFKIGCKHQWRLMTEEELGKNNIRIIGPCEHASICSKCGVINHVDSSD